MTYWLIIAARTLLPVLFILAGISPILLWVERRGAGLIQDRPGPNRVGPFGLFQPLADTLKLFFKEDVLPTHVDRFLYVLAPGIAMFAALSTFAVIPYGASIPFEQYRVPLIGSDAPIGLLYIFAVTSFSVYGVVLAGWASNNKYSLMGGLRASAQIISYELAMTTAAAGVLVATGSLKLTDVVAHQQLTWFGVIPRWNLIPQFFGFVVFAVAAFAETNRLPFDLPEAEAELVVGYHTEYSSMKFTMFYMSEYVNMAVASSLVVTLYLGGWSLPGFHPQGWIGGIASVLVFFTKVAALLWVFIWVRWTLPRFRYDQLMKLGWKTLLPLSLANLVWASLLVLLKVA
jgi:NADH-quinone oxidoreductase subunit H